MISDEGLSKNDDFRRLSTKALTIKDLQLEDGIFKAGDELEDQSTNSKHECSASLVFRRDHVLVIAWSLVLFVLLLYIGTIFLYRFTYLTFHIGPTGIEPIGDDYLSWNVWNYMVDALFWFDLIFNFFLAYEDSKGHEVVNMWLIAKQYLMGAFWLNLLACLPEQAYGGILQPIFAKDDDNEDGPVTDFGVARVYRLQRISRLARLSRLTRLAKLATFRVRVPGWDYFKSLRGVRVMKFVLGLFFACHLLACGWYLTAALHDVNDDTKITWVNRRSVMTTDGEAKTLVNQGPFEQWLVSMYFVLTVFTTVGFGDMSANTEAEIIFVVVIMFVGAVVHSIIISEVIQVVTSTDRNDEFKQQQMQLLDAFAHHADLEPRLFQSIRADLRERSRQWRANQTFNREDMKALLLSKYMPRQIIAKLPELLFDGKLCQNMFLQGCSAVYSMPPRLPCLMAMHLLPAEFNSGEVVFQLYDFSFNITLVLQGIFAYVGDPAPQGGQDAMLGFTNIDNVEPDEAAGKRQTRVGKLMMHIRSTRASTSDPARSQAATSVGRITTTPSRCTTTPGSLASEHSHRHRLYPYRLCGPKTCFGDLECITGSLRNGTVRCERAGPHGSASVLLLRKRELAELMQEFPQFGDIWASDARRRESRRCLALRRLTQPKTCRHLAASIIQRELSQLCVRRKRTSQRSEAMAAVVRSNGPAMLSAFSRPHAEQTHVKREVAKMSKHIGHLQTEMADQRKAMSEVKETLRVLLLRS